MVVFSVIERDVTQVREDDIAKFNQMRAIFGARDCEVLDWILSDGENFRSLAITTGAGNWDNVVQAQ